MSDKPSYWLVYFEDNDIPLEIFTEAEPGKEYFERKLQSWSCHLFVDSAQLETALAEANKRNESWQKSWDRLNRVFKTTSDKTIDQDMEIASLNTSLKATLKEVDRLHNSYAEQLRIANEESAKLRAALEKIIKLSHERPAVGYKNGKHWFALDECGDISKVALAVHAEEKPANPTEGR